MKTFLLAEDSHRYQWLNENNSQRSKEAEWLKAASDVKYA
jgi:hypothetical protein